MDRRSTRLIKVPLLHALAAAWSVHGLLPDDDTAEAGDLLRRVGLALGIDDTADTAEGTAAQCTNAADALAWRRPQR